MLEQKQVNNRTRFKTIGSFLALLLMLLIATGLKPASAAPETPLTLSDIQAISQKGTITFDGERNISSAVIDQDSGFAYLGTSTSPASIIKIRLSDFTRVDTITLQDGEDDLTSAVIDPRGEGYAYFGTDTQPGIVVKIRLSDFRRIGAITLGSSERNLMSAVINLSEQGNNFAYFGTDTTPGRVIQINLDTFTHEETIIMPDSSEGRFRTAVADFNSGYAYFGSYLAPASVTRINIQKDNFGREEAIPFEPGENRLSSSVIDSDNGFAYFGTDSNSRSLVKVDINPLNDLARIGVLDMDYEIYSAVIDAANGKAYFGVKNDNQDSRVERVDLATFTRDVGAGVDSLGSDPFFSAVIDTNSSKAYFATLSDPAYVHKIDLSGENLASEGEIQLNEAATNFWAAAIDEEAGFAYFGTYDAPAVIAKVDLSDFSKVATLTLPNGDEGARSAVIDPEGGFVYFGLATRSTGKVAKIRLSDFSFVESITMDSGVDDLTSAVIDTANGFAYFGTNTSPGMVQQIQLSDFTAAAMITLDSGEDGLTSAVIDTENGFAYFGTDTSPGQVIKVDVDPSRNFQKRGVVTLDSGLDKLAAAAIDVSGGRAYFGTNTSTGKVVRIDIDPQNSFEERGSIDLTIGRIASAVINPSAGYAYFGSQEQAGEVSEVDLSVFQEESTITLNNGEDHLTAAVIDTTSGCAYFGSGFSSADGFDTNDIPNNANEVMQIKTGECKDQTITTLTASPSPSDLNESVTFTAEVTAGSGTPSGSVKFSVDGNELSTQTLTDGKATYSISLLPVGPNSITAEYSGDSDYAESSADLTHTVEDSRLATTILLIASPNPSTEGEEVTLTTQISAAIGEPSGTVTFYDGDTELGTAEATDGIAMYKTSSLTEGDHGLRAEYAGDTNYGPSSSNTYNHTVKAGTTGPDPDGDTFIYLPYLKK